MIGSNMIYTMDSSYEVMGKLEGMDKVSSEEIKKEAQIFRASYEFAFYNGGDITRQFLRKVFNTSVLAGTIKDTHILVDTRYHNLFPKMYPCIPGWHHDYVDRNTSNGQPNYINPRFRAVNYMMLVNAEVAPTEFYVSGEPITYRLPTDNIYNKWHKYVETDLNEGLGYVDTVKSGEIIRFNDRSFHQGVAAVKRGWRMFLRATVFTGTDFPEVQNEIRTQTQVYLTEPFAGW